MHATELVLRPTGRKCDRFSRRGECEGGGDLRTPNPAPCLLFCRALCCRYVVSSSSTCFLLVTSSPRARLPRKRRLRSQYLSGDLQLRDSGETPSACKCRHPLRWHLLVLGTWCFTGPGFNVPPRCTCGHHGLGCVCCALSATCMRAANTRSLFWYRSFHYCNEYSESTLCVCQSTLKGLSEHGTFVGDASCSRNCRMHAM